MFSKLCYTLAKSTDSVELCRSTEDPAKSKIKINMARLKRFWYFLPVLQLLSVFYGIIHLTNGNYVEQYLESVEVCSGASGGSGALSVIADITKKKLRLANFPNNTVVVKLTRWNQLWPSFYNFRCQFSVIAPKRSGVMMTIESMHLRTKGSKSCADFIKFRGDTDGWGPETCGEVDRTDKSEVPETLIGPRYVASSKRGEIDVTFYTTQRDENEKEISLSIVFTAFQDCSKVLSDDFRQCSPSRKMSCIPKVLFCDKKLNCGFENDFGIDEGSDCSSIAEPEIKRSMSIFVFVVTAVSTLVVVIMCSLIACCCIRKFQKPPRNTNLQHNHIDMEFNLEHSGLPTAPPLTLDRNLHTPSTTKSDNDLPPPYAALFPDRSDVSITQPVQKKK